MVQSNTSPWYLRERYAILVVFAVIAVIAAVLGVAARHDAGNEPTSDSGSSSSSATS